MQSKRFTTLSLFIAITCLLQILSTFINFIGIPVTLSLIPIVIGGALYGIGFGSVLGLCFGIIVTLMVIFGIDPTGATMFSMHPFITIILCLLKGTLAGLLSSLIYNLIQNKKISIIISSLTATLSNTIIFLIFLFLFFDTKFSAITSILISVNFLIEIIVNLILAPSLLPIINKNLGH